MTANILAILMILGWLITGFTLRKLRFRQYNRDPFISYTYWCPPKPPAKIVVVNPDIVGTDEFVKIHELCMHRQFQLNVCSAVEPGDAWSIDPSVFKPDLEFKRVEDISPRWGVQPMFMYNLMIRDPRRIFTDACS